MPFLSFWSACEVLRVLERDRPDLHGDEAIVVSKRRAGSAGALGIAKRSPCRNVLGEMIGIPVITDGRP
jgi:hypothetical protein